jgi:aspartate carbamoyltransferase catalytic subunit
LIESGIFKGRDLISMRDFSRDEIDYILDKATEMQPLVK